MKKQRLKRILSVSIACLAVLIIVLHWTADPAVLLPANSDREFDVIAHRGGRGVAPENTLLAFETAEQMGVDVLEMDIHLTKDLEIVVIHDATINRTTNGEGAVSNFTLQELQGFDAAYYFSPKADYNNPRDFELRDKVEDTKAMYPYRGKGITVPTLYDVFSKFPQKRMIIELKPDKGDIIEPFCDLISNFHKEDQIIVGSFHGDILVQFREICPGIATSASPGEVVQFLFADKVFLAGTISPTYIALQIPPGMKKRLFGFLPKFAITSPSLINSAHKKRVIVQVWTVNDSDEMKQMIEMGVDGVMTDYPDRLIKILDH